MTVVIDLPVELERKLQACAAAAGKDAATYVREAVEDKLHGPRSLDEILAPFRREVLQSGMSDQELDAFYEGLRDEVWREGPGRTP